MTAPQQPMDAPAGVPASPVSETAAPAAATAPVAADAAPQHRPARTVVLLRHARSTANAKGVLAGRSAGVELDETGVTQADTLVGRLADVPIARLVSSPVLRCLRTLAPLAAARGLPVEQDEGLAEVDYGEWTGRPLSGLGGEALWRTVQAHPSGAVFPGGEGLAAVGARAVATVRRLAASTEGDGALLICSHGDVIKSILADALGMHLDQFQRISVGPASVSVVRYTEHRPFVELLGETGSLAGIVPAAAPDAAASDATAPNPAAPEATAPNPAAPNPAAPETTASDTTASDAVPGGDPGNAQAAVASGAAPGGSESGRPALS